MPTELRGVALLETCHALVDSFIAAQHAAAPVPVSYTIDSSQGFVLTTVTGQVSVSEMRDHYLRLRDDPEYRPNFRALSDFSEAAPFEATGPDLWQLAKLVPVAPGARRAIVVSSELHYGFGRMVSQVRSDSDVTIAVFRERAEALAWLGVT